MEKLKTKMMSPDLFLEVYQLVARYSLSDDQQIAWTCNFIITKDKLGTWGVESTGDQNFAGDRKHRTSTYALI